MLLNNKKYDDLLEVTALSMSCPYFMLEPRKVKVNKIEKITEDVISLKLNNIFYELLNCYMLYFCTNDILESTGLGLSFMKILCVF